MARTLLPLLCAAALLAVLAPAAGAADKASGSSRLALDGKGMRELRKLGVRMSSTKPVRVSRSALTLPVSSGTLGSTVRLDGKGTLTLRRGRRKVRLTAPQVRVARKKGAVTIRWGKRRVTLFSVSPARGKALKVNAATGRATLQSARLTMPGSTAHRIRRALRLRRAPKGAFGTVTVIATVKRKGAPSPLGRPIPGPEPPVLARPATAVDVAMGGIVWEPRTSLVRYMDTQPAPGGGTYPSDGAAPAPGEGSPAYRFTFRPLRGWWDPATQTAALYYGGRLNFRYWDHGIDFDTKDPEIEINGAASRAIFRIDGRRKTPYGNRRGVLLDLEAGTAAGPRCTAAATTVTCADIPARVPAAAGSSVFAGFYQPGDQFGDITVSFTRP